MYDKDVQEVLEKLAIFDKMYEVIRFVDPIEKKVISYKKNMVTESKTRCFDFWGKNKICNNCISIRAYNENKTFVKVEYTVEKVFMITAIPVELEDRRIVIELLKDTTDSMFLTGGEQENNMEIYSMIDNMNNMLLKDALTGVYNRRYINEKLPVDLLNAVLLEQEISVIMADIDFFKQVNDQYGHLAGDEILKQFAAVLSGCLKRESDWLARYGGEEFLICIPGATKEKTLEIAETMRKAVEATEMFYKENTIKITASFGVSIIRPEAGSKQEDLIEAADHKLYEAKRSGRNRVEI